MRARQTTAAQGFTLIEVLVAVLLLSLLLAGAWGGVHTATRAIRSGDRGIERVNRLRVTQAFLRRQISHAMPLQYGEDKKSNGPLIFKGEHDFMRFVAPMPGYLSRGGAYVQTLKLEDGPNGKQLLFSDLMLNGLDEDDLKDAAKDPVVLLDGIAEGRFEYRTLDDQGELDDWTDDWEDSSLLPIMVRVDLTMRDNSRIVWPMMDIPLMLDVGSQRGQTRSAPAKVIFK